MACCPHTTCRKFWEDRKEDHGGCKLTLADKVLWSKAKTEETTEYYDLVNAVNKEERRTPGSSTPVEDTRSETEKERDRIALLVSAHKAGTVFAVVSGVVVRRPAVMLADQMWGKGTAALLGDGIIKLKRRGKKVRTKKESKTERTRLADDINSLLG